MVTITVVMLKRIVSTNGVMHKINVQHYIRALNFAPNTPARLYSVTSQLTACMISGLRRYHLRVITYISCRDIQIFSSNP